MQRTSCASLAVLASVLSACATPSAAGRVADPRQGLRDPSSLLCVVRHAQAHKNLDPPPAMTAAQLDSLTAVGVAQVEHLRLALPAGVAIVLASPTGRTVQTAELLGLPMSVEVAPELSSLRGGLPLAARQQAWASGEDPRPAGGETLADGAARATAVIDRLRRELAPGSHAVAVTHGDIAPVLIGELAGTPLLERPALHPLATGAMTCLPLRQPQREAGGDVTPASAAAPRTPVRR
jgi:broad specificity phosphatase PhoE